MFVNTCRLYYACSSAKSVVQPLYTHGPSTITNHLCVLYRLHREFSIGYLSGVVCVQRPAPLPGAVVRAGQQGHLPAVPLPLLHPALLLLWQYCCGPHLGPLPSHLQLQGIGPPHQGTPLSISTAFLQVVEWPLLKCAPTTAVTPHLFSLPCVLRYTLQLLCDEA